MNWLWFAVVSWLFVGLDVGFAPTFQFGTTPIAPCFAIILLTFIAMWSPTSTSLTAGVFLGLVIDVLRQIPTTSGSDVTVLGPHALGFLLAAYTVRIMRSMMFRRGALAVGFLSMVSTAVALVVATAVLSIRAGYDPILIGSSSGRIWSALGSAVITGFLGVPLGWLMTPLRKPLGFPQSGRQAFRMP